MNDKDTLLEFPCQFPIKVMGKNQSQFDSIVVAIVNRHVEMIPDSAVKTRESNGGKFLAVTITIEATSKQQLDAIYQDLTDCPEVIMSL